MQRGNVLMAGFLAAIILCFGAALAQDFAPDTGTFIKAGEMNGLCRLDIINNGSDDAVAYLSSMQKKIVAAVYIRGGDYFNLTGIEDGSYELYFKQGQSWSNSTGKFAVNATGSRMEEPLTFETQKTPEGMRYTWSQVTLDDVLDGNAVVVPVSEEDFPV
ncbi:MAG: hypothetical protein M0Q43_00215 [Methanothrix sp.]|jgi:hypothetical protein|nr:hypothetical protein [Methanothrix sp.]